MPRKNAMRDNVNAVRSRLTHLPNLSREQIELALLHYESNIDQTVDAFNRNGAMEALSGWMEMTGNRRNSSTSRRNNKPRDVTNKSLTAPPVNNGLLRPSQRVSNIFQTFAEGGKPIVPINTSTTTITTIDFTLPSTPSEEMNLISNENDVSIVSKTETTSLDLLTTINDDDVFIEPSIEQPKPQRRRSVKSRNNSTTQSHELSTSTSNKSPNSNNRKLLAKSMKDLQRQTSTLTNVELSFDNEIKSSIKRIDEIFKQLHEILKEREIELYLEIDRVKEQGLNVIHRRQHRAIELRQQIDRCDRLELHEIDQLRTDIKQFVTGGRYELGEELTSTHRFEYDQTLIESLKNFGHVLKLDRRSSIAPTTSLTESIHSAKPSISDIPQENVQNPTSSNINIPISNSPAHGKITSGNNNHSQNLHSSSQVNGHSRYNDNSFKDVRRRRRRPPSFQYSQQSYPALNYQNENPRRNGAKQVNGGSDGSAVHFNYSEATNTYRRPRPSPPKTNVPMTS